MPSSITGLVRESRPTDANEFHYQAKQGVFVEDYRAQKDIAPEALGLNGSTRLEASDLSVPVIKV